MGLPFLFQYVLVEKYNNIYRLISYFGNWLGHYCIHIRRQKVISSNVVIFLQFFFSKKKKKRIHYSNVEASFNYYHALLFTPFSKWIDQYKPLYRRSLSGMSSKLTRCEFMISKVNKVCNPVKYIFYSIWRNTYPLCLAE